MNKLTILLLIFSFNILAKSDQWAVLVAGSNQYYNYRHQSDVCHAYQTLLKKGFNPNHIITMAYDDIAYDSENPFPGKIFNKPTFEKQGVDVYKGCKLDYTQDDVNPQTFLAVLTGNDSLITKNGTKRVLNSTKNDSVFLNFVDHGATGLIAFPNDYLYADQLLNAFKQMHSKQMYKNLVFYLEACESGSMFVNLAKNLSLYAVSAAGVDESSWANYCSPQDQVANVSIGSCLGDLFSTNWMEDSDAKDTSIETLSQQYDIVKNKTSQSHVLQWGDVSFTNLTVGNFIGSNKALINNFDKLKDQFIKKSDQQYIINGENVVNSRYVKLNYLMNKNNKNMSKQNTDALNKEIQSIKMQDQIFQKLIEKLSLGEMRQYEINYHITNSLNYECLRNTVNHYERSCGKFTDYGLQYIRILALSCSHSLSSEENIKESINSICLSI